MRQRRDTYVMIKGSIQQEVIAIVNIYAPNTGTPKYIIKTIHEKSTAGTPKYVKQILTDIKRETDGHTIIVGNFTTLLTLMDKSSRQKFSKENMSLNNTLDHMDTDMYVIFHSKTTEYTFFLSPQGTFS